MGKRGIAGGLLNFLPMFDDLTTNEYRIEWSETANYPAARIHVNGIRTSAYIVLDMEERPPFLSPQQWEEALEMDSKRMSENF